MKAKKKKKKRRKLKKKGHILFDIEYIFMGENYFTEAALCDSFYLKLVLDAANGNETWIVFMRAIFYSFI